VAQANAPVSSKVWMMSSRVQGSSSGSAMTGSGGTLAALRRI